jgi:hypothetical protein
LSTLVILKCGHWFACLFQQIPKFEDNFVQVNPSVRSISELLFKGLVEQIDDLIQVLARAVNFRCCCLGDRLQELFASVK